MQYSARKLNVGLVFIACCFLFACSSKSDNPDLNSLSSESLFGEDTQYVYLNQLFGGMSSRAMFDMVDNMMNNMNAAVRNGDASVEDYENLIRVITHIHDWMASTKPKTAAEEAAGSPGLAVLDMMVENNMGSLITSAIRAAGPDIMTENVYPMMAYVMACDRQIVKDAVNGITINDLGFDTSKLNEQDFKTMVNVLHGMLDEDDPDYKDIYTAADALHAKIDAKGLNITVGDIKDIIPDMNAEDLDNLTVYIDLISAIHSLYDDDPKIKEDIDKMLYAAGYLMNIPKAPDKHNPWDTASMTDMERILWCLEDILKPEGRAQLKKFLVRLLDGVDYLDGADNIYGATNALTSIYDLRNPYTNTIPDLNLIDYSIYRNMFQMNQEFEVTEFSTNKVSLMRSIFMLFDVMCVISDTLDGAPTVTLLKLISDQEPYINPEYRDNILEYIVNLWGQACFHYPQSFHSSYAIDSATEYRPYPDPLQGTDWLFFKEDLRYAGIPTKGLSFLLNFVTDFPLDLPGYVMGILTDSMPSIIAFTGSNNAIHTTGHNHRMMTMGGPLIHYYGEIGHGSDLIHVIGYMNELSMTSYKPIQLWGNSATFRQTNNGTAFETIEGPFGYGLVYYMMRGASDAKPDGTNVDADKADIADPSLDLLVRVLYKLKNTPYENKNLLRALCDILTKQDPDTVEKTNQQKIDDLFADDGFIDNLYTFIHTNHAPLAQVCSAMGDVMLAALNPSDKQKDVLYTDDVVRLLQNSVLPKLGTNMKANSNAVRTLVYNGMKQADVDDEVSTAAADLAAIVCSKGDRIASDLSRTMPGMKQLIDAANIDYAYDSAQTKLQPLIDYLFDDINGKENPLVYNLKSLGYKCMGIYDETYNTRAGSLQINDNTPVMTVVDHVLGSKGLYDTEPVKHFLSDVTGDGGDVLWRLIGGGDAYDPQALHWLEKIFGDDMDDMFSWEFIRSMCLSYNGNDPIMLMVFKQIHLADSRGQAIEFNGVMNDMSTFFHNQEFQPGTRLFDGIFDALTVIVENWK